MNAAFESQSLLHQRTVSQDAEKRRQCCSQLRSQSLLHQRTVSQARQASAQVPARQVSIASSSANSFTGNVGTAAGIRGLVSIASSSANSFTAIGETASAASSMASQSLLHQRTVSQLEGGSGLRRSLFKSQSLLHQRTVSQADGQPLSYSTGSFVSIASSSANSFTASTAGEQPGGVLPVSIASSSANSFTGGWSTVVINPGFAVSIASSSANSFTDDSPDAGGGALISLNRFFISEQFHSFTVTPLTLVSGRSQSLLHQRTVSQCTALTCSPRSGTVSIASSSANSFTVVSRWLCMTPRNWSQSLLHQRTVSQRSRDAQRRRPCSCLNRFFISEQFHREPSPLSSPRQYVRLNRFFISEQFHSTR